MGAIRGQELGRPSHLDRPPFRFTPSWTEAARMCIRLAAFKLHNTDYIPHPGERSYMLLRDAIATFLLSVEANGGRAATIDTYRWRLEHFLDFIVAQGGRELEKTGPAEIDTWVVSLRRQGERYMDHPTRPTQKGGLSDATIAGRIQAVKTFFAWCVDRDYIDRSPARHLRKPKLNRSVRSKKGKKKVMSRADLDAIERVAEMRANAGRPRDLALVRFLAETGCRVGEIVPLRVSNLDLVNCEAVITDGKTGEDSLDFGERTATALRAWLDARPQVEHDFVFVNLGHDPKRYGQPLTESGVYQIFKRLARLAGIKGPYNPHSIRHLVGKHFTEQTNLVLAQNKLRHTNIRTTADFYAHQGREEVKDATRRLSLLNHVDE